MLKIQFQLQPPKFILTTVLALNKSLFQQAISQQEVSLPKVHISLQSIAARHQIDLINKS